MTIITAQDVKELREKTGAGFMSCKKALMKKKTIKDAIIFLREEGLSKAKGKINRVTSEGIINLNFNNHCASLIEINCETDFVSRDDDFKSLASNIMKQAMSLKLPEKDDNKKKKLLDSIFYDDNNKITISDLIDKQISINGEKICLNRFDNLINGDIFGGYLHSNLSIGVIISITLSNKDHIKNKVIDDFMKNISMHIAALNPLAIDRGSIDSHVISNEYSIFKKQASRENKPAIIIDKIISGKMNKFFSENCLLEQNFVKDSSVSVKNMIKDIENKLNTSILINKFIRFKVGENK